MDYCQHSLHVGRSIWGGTREKDPDSDSRMTPYSSGIKDKEDFVVKDTTGYS